MESEKIRVLVADDHSVLRRGIILSLSQTLPEAEFGEAGDDKETLRLVRDEAWDLVILDLSMPGRDGLEILKDIKENNPALPVIIFSMHPEDQFAVRSIKAGASAYLKKDIPSDEFAYAIRRVIKGERYLTPSVVELITHELLDDHKQQSHNILSDREFQVFLLIASGMTVSLISNKLGLSVKTVSVYRSNILKKMNLNNNSEITHYAFKHNLVG